MKPIKIDVDAVPEDKRTHLDYLGLFNDMTLGMADPAKVLSVCTHEAGHFFFGLEKQMEIVGMELPHIIYTEPDQFIGYGAKLKVRVIKNTVEEIGVMLAAGGIFSRELDNNLGPGDTDDRQIFDETCQNANLRDIKKIDAIWKSSQEIVRKRLEDSVFRNRMRELARQIMSELESAS